MDQDQETWDKGPDHRKGEGDEHRPRDADMAWVPQALVIGPLGVLDVVNMTGTLAKPFARLTAVGQPVHLQWVIHSPWIPAEAKFQGETIYSIRPLTATEIG